MARTPVSRSCDRYRDQLHSRGCEIAHLILADPESSRWIGKQTSANAYLSYTPAVHHLWGRVGKVKELNWHCSLIQLWTVSHLWCHANPAKGEICCLKAKLDRWQDWLKKNPSGDRKNPIDPEMQWWNPVAMGVAIRGAHKPGADLRSRIELLMEKNESEIFTRYGREVLDFLDHD